VNHSPTLALFNCGMQNAECGIVEKNSEIHNPHSKIFMPMLLAIIAKNIWPRTRILQE